MGNLKIDKSALKKAKIWELRKKTYMVVLFSTLAFAQKLIDFLSTCLNFVLGSRFRQILKTKRTFGLDGLSQNEKQAY